MGNAAEETYLGRVQSSWQGFNEKKERTTTGCFFQVPRSFSAQQIGEAGHNVGTELMQGRSHLCGQRESVIGKRNVDVDTMKMGSPRDNDSTMCIADALYIWDRYFDAGDRFIGQWEPSCNTQKMIKRSHAHTEAVLGIRMLFFGKTIQEENKLKKVHEERFFEQTIRTSGMFANPGFRSALYPPWKVHGQSLFLDKKNRNWTVFGM